MRVRSLALALCVLAPSVFSQHATTALPRGEWSTAFGVPGADDSVRASVVFDDGSGPKLYVGGRFDVAGRVRSLGIARWSGRAWEPVGGNERGVFGGGSNAVVEALHVHDFGAGPVLVAGGAFSRINGTAAESLATWDGQAWSELGAFGQYGAVTEIASDGSTLYVAGQFSSVSGVAAQGVAKYESGVWSPLGAGLSNVLSLAVATVNGTKSVFAGRQSAPVARWNGSAWEDVPGSQTAALALIGLDVGNGVLIIGGNTRLQAYNGTLVSDVSDDAPRNVWALVVDDSGANPVLYSGGLASGTSPELESVMRWQPGGAWTPVGAPTPTARLFQDRVATMALGNLGTGAGVELFAGGEFLERGGIPARNLVALDPVGNAPGRTLGRGQAGSAGPLVEFDDGTGPALYIGGPTGFIGTIRHGGVARWNASAEAWEPVGGEFGDQDTVKRLAVFDDGTGPALYAIGRLQSYEGSPLLGVAKWDGSTWSDVGGGLIGSSGNLNDVVVHDDGSGPALYVGGSFEASPTLPGQNIARWDGLTWSPVGGGLTGGSRDVQSLAVHDDGTGAKLYAGGDFTQADGKTVGGLAVWTGTAWFGLGSGVNAANFDEVLDLESVDLPVLGGKALVAAGEFRTLGGRFANCIGYWQDGSWEHLDHGFGLTARVIAVTVHDDGTGPVLFAAGDFARTNAGFAVRNLARWNGLRWVGVDGGIRALPSVGGGVYDLTSFPYEGRPALWASGAFERAGELASVNVAVRSRAQEPLVPVPTQR